MLEKYNTGEKILTDRWTLNKDMISLAGHYTHRFHLLGWDHVGWLHTVFLIACYNAFRLCKILYFMCLICVYMTCRWNS